MKPISHLLLCFVFSLITISVFAQDEIYDEPARIIDTLSNTQNSRESRQVDRSDKKEESGNEDALSKLEKKKEKLNNLRIGGSFGLQFGTYTYVNVSPTIGYLMAKKRLELGGGPILIYQRYRYSSNYAVSFFVYGADVYAKGYLYKGLYLEARFDPVNKPSYFDLNKRLWVHHLLLGAGYAAPIGKIGSFYISLLYNVLDNDESIYQGTFSDELPLILNMGFGFGVGGK